MDRKDKKIMSEKLIAQMQEDKISDKDMLTVFGMAYRIIRNRLSNQPAMDAS